MKETEDNKNHKIRGRVAKLLFVAIVAISATIFGQSFTKNVYFYNTKTVLMTETYANSASNNHTFFRPQSLVEKPNSECFVHLSGKPIGIAIRANGLIVSAVGGVRTDQGEVYPTKDLVSIGDIISAVNGTSISSIYELKKILAETTGDVTLTVQREGKNLQIIVNPAQERLTGQRKLGLALREDVGGIGTMTFVTKGGGFAALGHHISDGDTGLTEELNSGNIYNTSIEAVEKGEIGKAGGLIASVNRLSNPIGKIRENTLIGLYGEYSADADGEIVRVALKGEAQPGHAKVLTTIEGNEPSFYDIEIVKVVSQTEPADKGMVILVSDKELLQKTGGIVQGMSGSPIIQNGILVGAVTHVFVQDPTRGYAVHARFMYDEAKKFEGENFGNNGNQTVPNINDIDIAA